MSEIPLADLINVCAKHPRDMTYKEAFQSGPEVWMNHQDPNGLPQHAPGAKNDAGKQFASLLLNFSRALSAVAEVATYGANKYTRDGWEHVPDGITRYRDAEWRHLLKGNVEECDPESGLPHAWHRLWNSLAALELELRQQNDENEPCAL